MAPIFVTSIVLPSTLIYLLEKIRRQFGAQPLLAYVMRVMTEGIYACARFHKNAQLHAKANTAVVDESEGATRAADSVGRARYSSASTRLH